MSKSGGLLLWCNMKVKSAKGGRGDLNQNGASVSSCRKGSSEPRNLHEMHEAALDKAFADEDGAAAWGTCAITRQT